MQCVCRGAISYEPLLYSYTCVRERDLRHTSARAGAAGIENAVYKPGQLPLLLPALCFVVRVSGSGFRVACRYVGFRFCFVFFSSFFSYVGGAPPADALRTLLSV